MQAVVPVVSGLYLSFLVGCIWLRYFSGLQIESKSPAGDYVAVVRTSGSMSAIDSDSSIVQIRSRWQLGRDLLFQASGDGAQVSLRWVGPKQLEIVCHHCVYAHIDYQQSTWRDVEVNLKTE